MKLIKLENSFHNTGCFISKKYGDTPEEAWENLCIFGGSKWSQDKLARKTFLRVYNTLCGIEGCKCGIVRM